MAASGATAPLFDESVVGLSASTGAAARDGAGGLPRLGASASEMPLSSPSASGASAPGAEAKGDDAGEVAIGVGATVEVAFVGAVTAETGAETEALVGDFAGEWVGAKVSGSGAGASAAADDPAAARRTTTNAVARYIFRRDRGETGRGGRERGLVGSGIAAMGGSEGLVGFDLYTSGKLVWAEEEARGRRCAGNVSMEVARCRCLDGA